MRDVRSQHHIEHAFHLILECGLSEPMTHGDHAEHCQIQLKGELFRITAMEFSSIKRFADYSGHTALECIRKLTHRRMKIGVLPC